MAIKTPDVLPGEPGYVSRKERNLKLKEEEKKRKARKKRADSFGKVKLGGRGFRFGRPRVIPSGKKIPLWRYSKNIGELFVSKDGGLSVKFRRFGKIGNYKHLIQDASFQLEWATREQELLMTQKECYLCKRKLSKTAKPNLYHFNMWKKSLETLEEAERVPAEVACGKLSVEKGWEKFNQILESANKYYMSLKDTALICSSCAKKKNLSY